MFDMICPVFPLKKLDWKQAVLYMIQWQSCFRNHQGVGRLLLLFDLCFYVSDCVISAIITVTNNELTASEDIQNSELNLQVSLDLHYSANTIVILSHICHRMPIPYNEISFALH